MATGGEYPPSNPQECGVTLPREDFETHQEEDVEHVALKEENAKLKKKMRDIKSEIKKIRHVEDSYVEDKQKVLSTVKKIHIIANASILKKGRQLSLSLSESGKRYIIVSRCTFRLTWSRSNSPEVTKFKLYDETGLPDNWKCDVKLITTGTTLRLATICCGESHNRDNLALGTCPHQGHIQEVRIVFAIHDESQCGCVCPGCACHDPTEHYNSDLTESNDSDSELSESASESDSESSDDERR